LVDAKYKLVLMSIIPIEKGFAKSWKIRKIIPLIAPLDSDFIDEMSGNNDYWKDSILN
jgi:hypothetical protein